MGNKNSIIDKVNRIISKFKSTAWIEFLQARIFSFIAQSRFSILDTCDFNLSEKIK